MLGFVLLEEKTKGPRFVSSLDLIENISLFEIVKKIFCIADSDLDKQQLHTAVCNFKSDAYCQRTVNNVK